MFHRLALRRFLCIFGALALGYATPARGTASAPATTQTAAGLRNYRLADAVPVSDFRGENHDVDLPYRITFEDGSQMYFGQADRYGADEQVIATAPLVVAQVKGEWRALDLRNARLPNAEWQFVASGPADDEIWGVLDDTTTNKGRSILLAHSTDSGQTWSVSAVAKPFGAGDYDSFAMNKDGHGRLSVYISADEKHPDRQGFYHLRTTDGGKTWSKPQREPDALDPADDVPDDEIPAPLQDAPTKQVMQMRTGRQYNCFPDRPFIAGHLAFTFSPLHLFTHSSSNARG